MLTTKSNHTYIVWGYRVIGFLYLCSGAWCTFNSTIAAGFLGIIFESSLGLAEFFSVYGGLQIGIGLAMVLTSNFKHYLEGGLFFAAVLSSGLVFFRYVALVFYNQEITMILMALLESLIVLGLWWFWYLTYSVRLQDESN